MFPTAQMYTVSETTGLIFLWRFQDFFYEKRIHDPKSIVMASQPAVTDYDCQFAVIIVVVFGF